MSEPIPLLVCWPTNPEDYPPGHRAVYDAFCRGAEVVSPPDTELAAMGLCHFCGCSVVVTERESEFVAMINDSGYRRGCVACVVGGRYKEMLGDLINLEEDE